MLSNDQETLVVSNGTETKNAAIPFETKFFHKGLVAMMLRRFDRTNIAKCARPN
jgi:hypothetical protein